MGHENGGWMNDDQRDSVECRVRDTIHEYAFDVTLTAVIRVKARSEREAMEILDRLQAESPEPPDISIPWEMTEWSVVSMGPPDTAPKLFEIDGKEVS